MLGKRPVAMLIQRTDGAWKSGLSATRRPMSACANGQACEELGIGFMPRPDHDLRQGRRVMAGRIGVDGEVVWTSKEDYPFRTRIDGNEAVIESLTTAWS